VERLKKQLEQEVDKRKELFSATQSNKFQIGELETKCSELENENETLKKSIQSLDEQIRSLQFLLSSKNSENINLRDEIKKLKKENKDLRSQISGLSIRLQALEETSKDKFIDTESEKEAMRNQLAVLSKAIISEQKQNFDAELKLKQYEEDHESMELVKIGQVAFDFENAVLNHCFPEHREYLVYSIKQMENCRFEKVLAKWNELQKNLEYGIVHVNAIHYLKQLRKKPAHDGGVTAVDGDKLRTFIEKRNMNPGPFVSLHEMTMRMTQVK